MFNISPSETLLNQTSLKKRYMDTLKKQGLLSQTYSKSIGNLYTSLEPRELQEFKISSPPLDEDLDSLRSMLQPFVKDTTYAINFIEKVGLEKLDKTIQPFVGTLLGYKNLTNRELHQLYDQFLSKKGLNVSSKMKQRTPTVPLMQGNRSDAISSLLNRQRKVRKEKRERQKERQLMNDLSDISITESKQENKEEDENEIQTEQAAMERTRRMIDKLMDEWNRQSKGGDQLSTSDKSIIINNLMRVQEIYNKVGDERIRRAIWDEISSFKKLKGKGIRKTFPYAWNPSLSLRKREQLRKGMVASGWK
jgi:hypothetical protein